MARWRDTNSSKIRGQPEWTGCFERFALVHAAAIGYIMLWPKIRLWWPFLIDDTQRCAESEFPGRCVNRNLARVADLSASGGIAVANRRWLQPKQLKG